MWYLISYMCPSCKKLHDVLIKAETSDSALDKFVEIMGRTLPNGVSWETPTMIMVSGVPEWVALAAIEDGDIGIQ